MSLLVIFSILVKLFGSILEIGAQSLISQKWSVEIYGTYSFYISLCETFYALFFSGIIKFNNFYIPQGKNVSYFKKLFYIKYSIPVFIVGLLFSIFTRNTQLICVFIAGFLYFCAMDFSSKMMSYGQYKSALIGEYCIGRLVVLILIIITLNFSTKKIEILYFGYLFQFVIAILFYKLTFKKNKLLICKEKIGGAVKKYVVFQSTEIAHTIIMQTSVIAQYIFGGAFQTAVISIVLVIRKLINFITGPTSKLYQPEFSKRFLSKDMEGLSKIYAQITRTQLCIMMPVFSFLFARPDLILRIYNNELITYSTLIRCTTVVFLFMIAFGPLSNFLCMTGNEKKDTLSNWISVFVMYVSMFCLRQHEYFVIYGFCFQIFVSTIYKLIVFIKYIKKMTMPLMDYIKIFIIFAGAILLLTIIPSGIIFCVIICLIQMALNFIIVFPKEDLTELISKLLVRRKRG